MKYRIMTPQTHQNDPAGLYTITCLLNQKQYIGESSNVSARLASHRSYLRRKIHPNQELQNDWSRFGEQAFRLERLSEVGAGLPHEKRLELETKLILELAPHLRYNVYPDSRNRGPEGNPFYGKKHTREAKEKIGQANSGSNLKRHRKPVSINGVYYSSISEASQKIGINRRLIRQRCHSNKPRFCKYIWLKSDIS